MNRLAWMVFLKQCRSLKPNIIAVNTGDDLWSAPFHTFGEKNKQLRTLSWHKDHRLLSPKATYSQLSIPADSSRLSISLIFAWLTWEMFGGASYIFSAIPKKNSVGCYFRANKTINQSPKITITITTLGFSNYNWINLEWYLYLPIGRYSEHLYL